MPEIGTSGSMSGGGKRSLAEWPKLPRPSSTLPTRTSRDVRAMSVIEGISEAKYSVRVFRMLTPNGHRAFALGAVVNFNLWLGLGAAGQPVSTCISRQPGTGA